MLAHGMLAMFLVAAALGQTNDNPPPPEAAPDADPLTSPKDSPSAQGLTPFRFQLDARLGLGVLKVTADDSPMILTGVGLPVALSAGLSLGKGLVVFGEISDTRMLLFDTSTSYATSVFNLYGAGLGLKLYLTSNTFISWSASMARVQLQRGHYAMDVSDWGVMPRMAVGREWPVSPTWSIGVAGEYQFATMHSGGLDMPWRYQPWALSTLVLASFHQADSTGSPAPDWSASPRGLYLDARVGIGRLWPRVGDAFWITGTSIPLALSAGFHVTKDVIAFGELSDTHMFGPSSNTEQPLYSLDLRGVGLGLKTYLTPRAYFLSASASFAQLRYEGLTGTSGSTFSETSRWGVLARLSLGREWPLSPSWSLGAAGELQFGRMAQGDDFQDKVYGGGRVSNETPYTVKGLSLLGLATFHPFAGSESAPSAGPGPVPVGHHTHDGFYANAKVGPGWMWLSNRYQHQLSGDPDVQWSGRGTQLELSVGYAFANRFVVFGEGSELQVHDPDGETDLATLARYAFGPGLRYYVMPANVFCSGSLLVSKVGMYNDTPNDSRYGTNRTSQWGAMGQVSVGKEWWVAGDLGVGVAAEFGYGKMAGDDYWFTYTAQTFSLVASVSYN